MLLSLFQERWSSELRQLSWHVFSMTGSVESYLLYKAIEEDQVDDSSDEEEELIEENDSFV